jgi:beta-lactamase class A
VSPGRLRPGAPARPAHAGHLARWERLAFTLAFALMAVFVAVIAVSSEGLRRPVTLPAAPGRSASAPAAGRGGPQRVTAGGVASGRPGLSRARRRAWDRALATALAPVLAQHAGTVGVGVIDQTTGAVAVYGGGTRFVAAGAEKAAILASLLLDRAGAGSGGAGLDRSDERLAAQMTEASDHSAGTRLWDAAGQGAGLAAAGHLLGLRHTVPGPAENWGATTTTVGDQLTLLSDLTTTRSPLSAAARSYELGLLRAAAAGQSWGVSAAASPGTSYAIQDGGLADGPANWAVSSIGVLEHGHQRLLLAVLADGQPTKAAGIALAQAAAAAAADLVTAAR